MSALLSALGDALVTFEWAVLAWFALANGWTLLLLVGATLEMRRIASLSSQQRNRSLLASPLAPTVTVLLPLHDEEDVAVDRVAALLALQYANLEVVAVNDGSRDGTLDVLRDHFQLAPVHPIYRRSVVTAPVRGLYRSRVYPHLVVVDKARGGRTDALNAGLNVATGELVCGADAGMLVESDAIARMVRPFLERENVLATGATIRIANGCVVRGGRVVEGRVPAQPLAGFQVVEYLRTFLFGRLGWNLMGGNLLLSNAFALLRRDAVLDVGGFTQGSASEDMDLVLRMRKRAHETGREKRVVYMPDPVAWMNAPLTTAQLGSQREHWHHGLADALWRHRAVLFDARYGALGFIVLPWFLFIELLAPVIELLGVLGLALGLAAGVLDPAFAVLFLLCAYALGAVLTVLTLVMDELEFPRYTRTIDRLRLIAWALVEPLGYRQLTVFWRLQGLEKFIRSRWDRSGGAGSGRGRRRSETNTLRRSA